MTATISGLAIKNGHTSTRGGGIDSSGNLTLVDSVVTGNVVASTGNASGGGIDNQGALSLFGSTVSGNQILGCATQGVGIGIATPGTANVTNSTIAGNTTPGGNTNASAIYSGSTLSLISSTITGNRAAYSTLSLGGSATLIDTLVARNADASGNMVVSGTVTGTSRNNLIGNGAGVSGVSNGSQGNQIGTTAAPINPKLDPAGLQANGGGGPATIGLLPNSPAI